MAQLDVLGRVVFGRGLDQVRDVIGPAPVAARGDGAPPGQQGQHQHQPAGHHRQGAPLQRAVAQQHQPGEAPDQGQGCRDVVGLRGF